MNWLLLFQVIGKLVAYKCVGPKFDSRVGRLWADGPNNAVSLWARARTTLAAHSFSRWEVGTWNAPCQETMELRAWDAFHGAQVRPHGRARLSASGLACFHELRGKIWLALTEKISLPSDLFSESSSCLILSAYGIRIFFTVFSFGSLSCRSGESVCRRGEQPHV
jgi:hypothetical protein